MAPLLRARARLLVALILATATISLAAACTPAPAPAPTDAGAPSATSAPTDPGATPEPEETPTTPTELTCETLIGADLVGELTDQGWTVRQDPFVIVDTEFPDGLSCTWGDFAGTAGDDLLLFGWSPITADEAMAARTALQAEGWIVEQGDDGVYVTEDPSQAIATDEEGYGMTYLFGDGWVALSDTKQGLVLIERPAS